MVFYLAMNPCPLAHQGQQWSHHRPCPTGGRTRGALGSHRRNGWLQAHAPEVVPTWFDDTLSVAGDLRSGWALWNFRGPFSVLDTQRAGTKFEDWHGHQLDRSLLALLQKKTKV